MRRLLLLVGAIVLVDTMFYAAITPLLPDYADRYSLSKSAAGILAGSYAAGTLLGSLPSGWLATRWGARRVVLLGLSLMTLASLGFAFGRDIEVLDVMRFAQGLGGACSFAGAFGWLLQRTPASERGRAIGTTMAAAIGGALLGPVLGALARGIGPQVAFCGVAALGCVLIAAALRTPGPSAPSVALRVRTTDALRERRIQGGMVLVLVPALVFGTVNVLAPLELDRLGATAIVVGATFLVSAGIEAAVQAIVGRVSDRHGRRLPILVSLGGSVVLALLMPLPHTVWLLSPLIVVAFVVFGSLYTPSMALLSDGADAVGLDQALGAALVNLTWAAGQVLGAVGGSALADATSDAVPYLALACVLAMTLATLLRRAPVAAS
jgi:MFS family permease